MFSTLDTVNSQIKHIENSPSQRLFVVNETENFIRLIIFNTETIR